MDFKIKKRDTATAAPREKEAFYKYLAQKGLKRTAQRDAVLELFLSSPAHMTAEQIYEKLRANDSGIGYATVYRTMRLLKECELAREVYFADGRIHFEHHFEQPHHDHMICIGCGDAIEFYNETIEKLQDQMADEHGFTPVRHTMTIFGYCRACGGAKTS